MDMENLISMIKSISLDRMLFFVGSGISLESPSCLPTGNQLAQFILDISTNCGGTFKNIWNEVTAKIDESSVCTNYPRLESIAACVMNTEIYVNIHEKLNFIDGFSSFQDAPFNHNHALLAIFMHHGATIITTNFDLCIQNAYIKIFGERLQRHVDNGDGGVFYYSTYSNVGKIIHIHGTSDSREHIGVTLDNLMSGVVPSLNKHIEYGVNSSIHCVYMGYSFSDAFDISPFIKRLASKALDDTKHCIILNSHNDHTITRMSKIFAQRQIAVGSATNFLMRLAKEFGISRSYELHQEVYNWKSEFIKKLNINTDFKQIVALNIAGQFRLDIDCILGNRNKTLDELIAKYNVDKRAGIAYGLYVTSKSLDCQALDKYFGDYHKRALISRKATDYNSVMENYAKKKLDYDVLEQRMIHMDKISWDTILSLSAWNHAILYKYLSVRDQSEVAKFFALLDKAIALPFARFPGMLAYATCLRYRHIMEAIAYKTIGMYGKDALEIYYDFGNFEGIISSFMYMALGDHIVLDQSINTNKYILKAIDIAKVVRSYRYIEKIDNLMQFLSHHVASH